MDRTSYPADFGFFLAIMLLVHQNSNGARFKHDGWLLAILLVPYLGAGSIIFGGRN